MYYRAIRYKLQGDHHISTALVGVKSLGGSVIYSAGVLDRDYGPLTPDQARAYALTPREQ